MAQAGKQAPERPTPLPANRIWLVVIVVAYGVLIFVSARLGTPKQLPGIDLGSPVLLHVERASAGLAIVAAVLIFAFQTSRGELPIQLGNFAGYPDPTARQSREQEVNRRVVERLEILERRIVPVEDAVNAFDGALSLVTEALTDHEQRLADLDRIDPDE